MLRWLVVALLAANAVYYAGVQGHLAPLGWVPAHDQREPQRLERQVEPQRLRLLNGARGADPLTPATGQNPPAPVAAAPAVAAAVPAAVPAPAAAPAPEPAAAATTACWQAAGFSTEQAELLRAELRLLGLADNAWQLGEVRSAGRWIVYMGRYDNAEQATRKKAELRGMGLDTRDVNTPGLAPGIALGTFSSASAAQEALQQAERRGVRTARVVQERAESLSYTLRLPAITDALRQRIDGLGPATAGRPLQRCG
ncbi:MAG: SPOR domain-containing protein [Hydrogenophaga sp.]|uniref:SPOR domain-containing protein n=1 Tax=Hydrogenophaga sp. TaxID=1904254 RepID=UPI002579ACDC|nr:SPOR domain-containing protein [Hydrogenophaga sp.]MBL0945913.1 SPOR domain-containing protein [Hydrogenophaga sp.]